MSEERPRRFFGLFCSHRWKNIGMGTQSDGLNTKEVIFQQCAHCGDLRKWP